MRGSTDHDASMREVGAKRRHVVMVGAQWEWQSPGKSTVANSVAKGDSRGAAVTRAVVVANLSGISLQGAMFNEPIHPDLDLRPLFFGNAEWYQALKEPDNEDPSA